MADQLSERERTVLRYVIHDFIETATPVGSRYISRRHEDVLGLSSATIRNIMSDLEYLGYINHPHTSAGRVPTDRGYRLYLDSLMHLDALPEKEQKAIENDLTRAGGHEDLLRESSRVLGRISRQLCIVTAPYLSSGIFEKLEMVGISTGRVMVIISVKSGLVRTVMLEVESEIPREKLDAMSRLLNERLSGLTLQQIGETFSERMRDVQGESTGLIRLFIDSVDRLFVPARSEQIHIAGADKVIDQPEFVTAPDFRGVIELINDQEMIIHVLERNEAPPAEVRVTVGEEHDDDKLKPYSVITAGYTAGDTVGTIGVIGPKRMRYERMIPLVDHVARTISRMFSTTMRS